MNVRFKGRSLLSRESLVTRKTICDETRWLLISGSNSDIAEQTQIIDLKQSSNTLNSNGQNFHPLKRTSSVTELNGFETTRKPHGVKLCNSGACEQCSYPRIVARVSDDVRYCLPSPSLMRRRNAICDEIEKRTLAMPGRTLRQRRVDMLRSIALTQFSLL